MLMDCRGRPLEAGQEGAAASREDRTQNPRI